MKDLATVNIGEQNNSVLVSVNVLPLSCAEMKTDIKICEKYRK